MAKDLKETLSRVRLSINPFRVIGALVCFIIAVVAKKSKKLAKVSKPLMITSIIGGIVLLVFELETNFKPVDETELEFDNEELEETEE